jgi:energy-converting hydrogenase Eha subunit E
MVSINQDLHAVGAVAGPSVKRWCIVSMNQNLRAVGAIAGPSVRQWCVVSLDQDLRAVEAVTGLSIKQCQYLPPVGMSPGLQLSGGGWSA